MAIKQIAVDIGSNLKGTEIQLSQFISIVKKLDIKDFDTQPSIEKLERILVQIKNFNAAGDLTKYIMDGISAIGNVSDKAKAVEEENFGVIETGTKTIDEIIKLLEASADAIEKIDEKVPDDLDSIVSKLSGMGIAIGGMGVFVGIAGKLAKSDPMVAIGGLKSIEEIIKLLLKSAEALKQINTKVPRDIGKVGAKMANIGIAIGGMGFIVGVIGGLVATSGIGALIAGTGLATVYLIAKELIHISKAINQLDKNVPEDTSTIKEKIETIAETIGYFAESNLSNVFDLFGNIVGVLNTSAAADSIMKLAELGRELQKFEDIEIPKDIQTKIQEIQGVFEYLQKGIGLIGEIGQFFGGGSIDTKVGLKAVAAIDNLTAIATSMSELEKIEVGNTTSIISKIKSIQSIFVHFIKTKGWISDFDTAFNGGGIDTKVAVKAKEYIKAIAAIALSFEELQKAKIDSGTVEQNIRSIQSIFGSFVRKSSLGDRFNKFFEGGNIDTKFVKEAKKYVTNMAAIAGQLYKIQELTLSFIKIQTKLEEIQNIVSEFGKIDINITLDATSIKNSIDKVSTVNKLVSELETILSFTFDKEKLKTFKETMRNISEAIKEVLTRDFTPIDGTLTENIMAPGENGSKITNIESEFSDLEQMENIIDQAITRLEHINRLSESLSLALDFNFDKEKLKSFKETMKNISEAIKEVLTRDFTPIDGTLTENIVAPRENGTKITNIESEFSDLEQMENIIDQAITRLGHINRLSESLSLALGFSFDAEKLNTFIETMKNISLAIREVMTRDFMPSDGTKTTQIDAPFETGTKTENIESTISDITVMKGIISSSIDRLKEIKKLTDQFAKNLNFTFDETKLKLFTETMENIAKAVRIVQAADFSPQKIVNHDIMNVPGESGTRITETTTPEMDVTEFENRINNAKSKLRKLGELTEALGVFIKIPVDKEGLATTLLNTSTCLEAIRKFVADMQSIGDTTTIEAIKQSIITFKNMVTELSSLSFDFGKIGLSYALSLLAMFNIINPTGFIKGKVDQLVTDLQAKYSTFTEIGKTYGNNLKTGFAEGVANMLSSLTDVINKLTTDESKAQFTAPLNTLGNTLGASLIDGFKEGIRGMATAINEELSNVKTATTKSQGGEVEFHASGGLAGIFKKKGTDTVPAMLTPGEFVQRRAAVSTFGLDFMNKVNNLDVRGAFSALTGRFNTHSMLVPAVSTVVNNISHTTNNANKVTQNVVGGNADYIMKRASRYLR